MYFRRLNRLNGILQKVLHLNGVFQKVVQVEWCITEGFAD